NFQFRLSCWSGRFAFPRYALQACSRRGKINQFRYARFQCARSRSEKTQESQVKTDGPQIDVRNVYLVVNQQAYHDQIENDRCGHHPAAKTYAGQELSSYVIFRDGLKRNAPPEVAVDLNVPVVTTTVGGIAPAFLIEQPEHFAQEKVAVPPLLAPKCAATQASPRARAFRQMFVLPNDVCRCALET